MDRWITSTHPTPVDWPTPYNDPPPPLIPQCAAALHVWKLFLLCTCIPSLVLSSLVVVEATMWTICSWFTQLKHAMSSSLHCWHLKLAFGHVYKAVSSLWLTVSWLVRGLVVSAWVCPNKVTTCTHFVLGVLVWHIWPSWVCVVSVQFGLVSASNGFYCQCLHVPVHTYMA